MFKKLVRLLKEEKEERKNQREFNESLRVITRFINSFYKPFALKKEEKIKRVA